MIESKKRILPKSWNFRYIGDSDQLFLNIYLSETFVIMRVFGTLRVSFELIQR